MDLKCNIHHYQDIMLIIVHINRCGTFKYKMQELQNAEYGPALCYDT